MVELSLLPFEVDYWEEIAYLEYKGISVAYLEYKDTNVAVCGELHPVERRYCVRHWDHYGEPHACCANYGKYCTPAIVWYD